MNFFAWTEQEFGKLLNVITGVGAVLPAVAAAQTASGQDPKAAQHMQQIVTAVTPLVQAGEQISTQLVTAGQPALTGEQKLANVKNAFDMVMSLAAAAGAVNPQAELMWQAINAGITAAVAVKNAGVPAAPAPAS